MCGRKCNYPLLVGFKGKAKGNNHLLGSDSQSKTHPASNHRSALKLYLGCEFPDFLSRFESPWIHSSEFILEAQEIGVANTRQPRCLLSEIGIPTKGSAGGFRVALFWERKNLLGTPCSGGAYFHVQHQWGLGSLSTNSHKTSCTGASWTLFRQIPTHVS